MAHIQFPTTILNTDETADEMQVLADTASDRGLAVFKVHSGGTAPVYVGVDTFLYIYD